MTTTNQSRRSAEHHDVTSPIEDLAEKAQAALEKGLKSLDPQVVQWGETALASAAIAAGPVRRAFKTQPALTGAGVMALAAGGIMLAVAISRDVKSVKRAN